MKGSWYVTFGWQKANFLKFQYQKILAFHYLIGCACLESWEKQGDTQGHTVRDAQKQINENVFWWILLSMPAGVSKKIVKKEKTKWNNVGSLNNQHRWFPISLSHYCCCLLMLLPKHCWELQLKLPSPVLLPAFCWCLVRNWCPLLLRLQKLKSTKSVQNRTIIF